MKFWLIPFYILFIIINIAVVSQGQPIIWRDEPQSVVNDDGTRTIVFGANSSFLTWDGRWVSEEQLNFSNGNWMYNVTQFSDYYLIEADDISFRLPNRTWIHYDFNATVIKETMTIPSLAMLQNNSIGNSTVRYIPLPFNPSKNFTKIGNILELGRFRTKEFWIRDVNNSYYDVENNYSLEVINGEIRLYFNDIEWFQNASYPLTIDPTITIQGGTDNPDSFMNLASPGTNYGANTNLDVRSLSGSNRRSIIRFNLTAISDGAIIQNAYLNLYYYSYTAGDPSGRIYDVYPVWMNRTDAWVETQVTWNNYASGSSWTTAGGDYNNTPLAQATVPSAYGWMNWTVTQHVFNAKNASKNVTFLIRDSSESSSSDYRSRFYSRDIGNTSSPKLIVTYTLPDSTPPASITNLSNLTSTSWINWTWTNPADADFNYTMIYINGAWTANTSNLFYNLTGLGAGTTHTISTHTVDISGNINQTWVNQTTTTVGLPDLIMTQANISFSYVSSQVETGDVKENVNVTINATVYNNGSGSATNVKVSFYDGSPSTNNNIANATITSLAAGVSQNATVYWNSLAGTHNISVKVDPDDNTSENSDTFYETGYKYHRNINITAGSASIPSGYSIPVTFDHASLVSNGKSQSDGDDVRVFYWNGAWIELDRVLDDESSWNNASTKIWFKTQAAIGANASDSNYYLYYGNTSASNPPANMDVGTRVKSVQTGTLTSTANGTVTATITAVNMTKSFLVFETRHNSNRPPGSMVRGRIINSTSIEFMRITDEVAPEPVSITIRWYVVEFSSGVSVQRGEVSQSATTINVPITPVAAVSQAFVTWSKTPAVGDNNMLTSDDPIAGELTNTTNLQFRVNTAAPTHIIWWQVIEFTNASDINVQKGSISMTGTNTSVTASLSPPVDVNKTFVLVGFRTDGTGSDIGSRMLRAQLTNSTTITIDRSISGTPTPDNITEIVWQAIELKDGSTMQRGSENFTSGVAQKNVTINSVDLNRTVAFASVQPVGGQNMGRSPYDLDDVIGVGSVTMNLSATNITMERNNMSAPADIGWFVVEFGQAEPNVSLAAEESIAETNNDASKLLNVSAWQKYYGNVSGNMSLRDNPGNYFSNWTWVGQQGNVFITNISNLNFSNLQALGRNKDSTIAQNNFSRADELLNLTPGNKNATGFVNNNITQLFSTNGTNPRNTTSFVVYGKTINNVSIVNSTNVTNFTSVENATFITGVLWDTSKDDGDLRYGDDGEDLVFIAKINVGKTGIVGTAHDYEITVPSSLKGTGIVYFYVELK